MMRFFCIATIEAGVDIAISSVAMLEFSNYQIFHSQAGNVKNQQPPCR